MRKKPTNPQSKHEQHQILITPTSVAHHKYVMTCLDCDGAHIKWSNEKEYEIYMLLQSDNNSDAK